MFCPSCGQKIDHEIQFCQHCGEEIDAENVVRDSYQDKGDFAFIPGFAGLIGGIVVWIFAAFWFGATRYAFPIQAAISMWVFVLGMGIAIIAPLWYWFIRPILGGS